MRVRFERVTKRFGTHLAVDNIDLDVDSGECLVLPGPSGCGKTTVLPLLAGLEPLDSGRSGSATVASISSSPPAATSRWSSRATRCIRICPSSITSRFPYAPAASQPNPASRRARIR
jgi:ABC-type branched-subunit amino acid transport system ATPase component